MGDARPIASDHDEDDDGDVVSEMMRLCLESHETGTVGVFSRCSSTRQRECKSSGMCYSYENYIATLHTHTHTHTRARACVCMYVCIYVYIPMLQLKHSSAFQVCNS